MELKKINVYPVLTCQENEPIDKIAKKLRDKKERRIFVTDSQGMLKGLVTTTDLVYKALAENKNPSAKDIMITTVKSVDISEDLDKALQIMNEIKSFVCPVTDKGKILGIINYHDLVNHVFKEIEK